jgi:chitin disaccharide deacetylase
MGSTHKLLIVNADDFGMSPGVNRGIIEAHVRGIVTSASLMVRWPHAEDAAACARGHSDLSVGLHIDLGEWTMEAGSWVPLYEVIANRDESAVEAETARQLERFRRLIGRDPTHLDSHQHVHHDEPVRRPLQSLAKELRIPLRASGDDITYCGDFYGQGDLGHPYPEGISVRNLTRILATLQPGTTELCCHPGFDDGLATMYRSEREREVETLTDPAVRRTVEALGIRLISFLDIPCD